MGHDGACQGTGGLISSWHEELHQRARLVHSRARASPQRRATGHGAWPQGGPRSCPAVPAWRCSLEVRWVQRGRGLSCPRRLQPCASRSLVLGTGSSSERALLVAWRLLRLRPLHGVGYVPPAVRLWAGQCPLSPTALVRCADVCRYCCRARAVPASALASARSLAVQVPLWLGWQRSGSPGQLRGQGAGGIRASWPGRQDSGGSLGAARANGGDISTDARSGDTLVLAWTAQGIFPAL